MDAGLAVRMIGATTWASGVMERIANRCHSSTLIIACFATRAKVYRTSVPLAIVARAVRLAKALRGR